MVVYLVVEGVIEGSGAREEKESEVASVHNTATRVVQRGRLLVPASDNCQAKQAPYEVKVMGSGQAAKAPLYSSG